jgi:hypothetical protein
LSISRRNTPDQALSDGCELALARIFELKERAAVRVEVTVGGLIDNALAVFQEAREARQYSAAIAALREVAVLAGLRVERKESGAPGEFAHLSEAELDDLLAQEFRRIQAIPPLPPDNDDTADALSAKPD